MKKYLFISVALLAVAAACTPKESLPEDPNPQAPDTQIEEPASVIYIQARGEEQTKASVAGDTGGSLAFRSICAHLRFKLVSVPKQTQYITFDFIGKKVQGEFTLSSIPDLADAGTLSVFGGAQTSATTGADAVITVYNDGAFSTFQEGLILNIPVPAGIASTGEYLRMQVGGNVDKKRDNLLRSCLLCGR